MTPEIACTMLSNAGLHVSPADVKVEARDQRWVVRLPGRRLAWFAANEAGIQRHEDGAPRFAPPARAVHLRRIAVARVVAGSSVPKRSKAD